MEKSTSFHTICRLLLKELRQERNVYQAQISQRLNEAPSAWLKVEDGSTKLKLEHILAACTVFDILPSEFFHTAEKYFDLLEDYDWFVAKFGLEMPKSDDLLWQESDKYYAQLTGANPPARSRFDHSDVLNSPGHNNFYCPLPVFDWAINAHTRPPMPNPYAAMDVAIPGAFMSTPEGQ